MKNEIISVDLGSNSFRVLKFDSLTFKIIDEYHQVVGLADGLIETGIISNEAQNRVVEAFKKAKEKLNFEAKDAVCVTTAAARKAKNSKEVLSFFEDNIGAKFRIIDANEEARLTLLAVKYALKRENIKADNFILLDIGGGSTELIVSKENKTFTRSFDFGIVTMTQKHLKSNHLREDLENRKKEIDNFIDELDFKIDNFLFVATAGTPTTIAALKLGYDYFNYDRDKINGTILDLKDLQNALAMLRLKSIEEMTKIVGRGRVEYLEIGTYIYEMFFEALKVDKSIVLDDGLREGIAIDFILNSQKRPL